MSIFSASWSTSASRLSNSSGLGLAEMRSPLDLDVEVVDSLEIAVDPVDRAADLLVSLAAQNLHLVGETADRPAELVEGADHLLPERRDVGAVGESFESDLKLADLDPEVAIVAGRAERVLEQVLVALDDVAPPDDRGLTAHLVESGTVRDARDVARRDADAPDCQRPRPPGSAPCGCSPRCWHWRRCSR